MENVKKSSRKSGGGEPKDGGGTDCNDNSIKIANENTCFLHKENSGGAARRHWYH